MIVLPPLTAELVRQLGKELGGCDFTDENQQAFLNRLDACDVQAAPGNGKTTLLVAKLALLSRTWKDRQRGVCVVSHTNAAREEVQRRLGAHPSACAFLAYPHFIGTVTAFVDQFIALPYLRGLGWQVRRIDDDAFAAAAKALMRGKPTLMASHRQRQRTHQVESWVANLTLAENFVVGARTRLAVAAGNRQPGPNRPSGVELEEIKAALVSQGLYRYSDMHVLARRALAETPHLAARLRARFPLVILDEAQDTSGPLLQILNQIFAGGGALQRLGDQNQTLYEDAAIPQDQYWQPAADSIPLDKSRRFGPTIASFASRLTARRAQTITADTERPSQRLLLTFDAASITEVLPRYAAWAAEHLAGRAGADVRAVASRHNLYRDARGEWPKSLTDYYPPYRSGDDRTSRVSTLCGAMRRLAAGHASGRAPRESHALIGAALADYLDHRGFRLPGGARVRANSIWPSLASISPDHPALLRRLVIEHVLRGRAAEEQGRWGGFCADLLAAFPHPDLGPHGEYCAFSPAGAAVAGDEDRSTLYARFAGLDIRLGSVHSVKGATADAILMVETEVYRGSANDMRVMDLATVLPHAFGRENRDFSQNEAQLAAATNVFVAITRPRDLLALAVRDQAVDDGLRAAAEAQGWQVVRLLAAA
jgi:DNA helicase-2/ATP-dependent DNA helicase PcrA